LIGLRGMLEEEKERLEKLKARADLMKDDFPEGKLRISKDKGRARYYHIKNNREEEYIPKTEKELPRKLAQKSYNQTVMKKAELRIKQISSICKDYEDDEIEQLYTSLHEDRRRLVEPIEPTAEMLLEKWLSEEYVGKEFSNEMPAIITEKGERVRSKSEKILADYFYRNGIAYKYEKPLYLKGYGTIYPDFSFFSLRMRKEIYWEHEGMMDNPEYARSAIKKIEQYQRNGIYLGERLILTFETDKSVINSKDIDNLARRYLL